MSQDSQMTIEGSACHNESGKRRKNTSRHACNRAKDLWFGRTCGHTHNLGRGLHECHIDEGQGISSWSPNINVLEIAKLFFLQDKAQYLGFSHSGIGWFKWRGLLNPSNSNTYNLCYFSCQQCNLFFRSLTFGFGGYYCIRHSKENILNPMETLRRMWYFKTVRRQ